MGNLASVEVDVFGPACISGHDVDTVDNGPKVFIKTLDEHHVSVDKHHLPRKFLLVQEHVLQAVLQLSLQLVDVRVAQLRLLHWLVLFVRSHQLRTCESLCKPYPPALAQALHLLPIVSEHCHPEVSILFSEGLAHRDAKTVVEDDNLMSFLVRIIPDEHVAWMGIAVDKASQENLLGESLNYLGNNGERIMSFQFEFGLVSDLNSIDPLGDEQVLCGVQLVDYGDVHCRPATGLEALCSSLRVSLLNREIKLFPQVLLDRTLKRQKGDIEGVIKHCAYHFVHEHVRPELVLDVGLLDFHSNLISVEQSGSMHLSHGGRGDWLSRYGLKHLFQGSSQLLLNLDLDDIVWNTLGLILELPHPSHVRRREDVGVGSQPLPEFDVETIVGQTGLVDIPRSVLVDLHEVILVECDLIVPKYAQPTPDSAESADDDLLLGVEVIGDEQERSSRNQSDHQQDQSQMQMKSILLKTGQHVAGLQQFLKQNIKSQPKQLADTFISELIKCRQQFVRDIEHSKSLQPIIVCIQAGEKYFQLIQVLIRCQIPFPKDLKLIWLDILRKQHSQVSTWKCQELNTVFALICLHVRWFVRFTKEIAQKKIYIERIQKLLSLITHFRRNKLNSEGFLDLSQDKFITSIKCLAQGAVHQVKSIYIVLAIEKEKVDLQKEREFKNKLPAYQLFAAQKYAQALNLCVYDFDQSVALKSWILRKSSNLCFKAYLSYARSLVNECEINGDLVQKQGVRLKSCMARASNHLEQLQKNKAFIWLTQIQKKEIQSIKRKSIEEYQNLMKKKLFTPDKFEVDFLTHFIQFNLVVPVKERPIFDQQKIKLYLNKFGQQIQRQVQMNRLQVQFNRLLIQANSIDTSLEDTSQDSLHRKEVIKQARISVKKLPVFQAKTSNLEKLMARYIDFNKIIKEAYSSILNLYKQHWKAQLYSIEKAKDQQAIEAQFRSLQPICKEHQFLKQVFQDQHNLNLIEQFNLDLGSFNTVSFLNIKHKHQSLFEKVASLRAALESVIKQLKNEPKRSPNIKKFSQQKQKLKKQLQALKDLERDLKNSAPRLQCEKSKQFQTIAKANFVSLKLRSDLQSLLQQIGKSIKAWGEKMQNQFVMIFDQCQQLQFQKGLKSMSVELPLTQLTNITQQANKLL